MVYSLGTFGDYSVSVKGHATEVFGIYDVRIRTGTGLEWSVSHRFADFAWLRKRLLERLKLHGFRHHGCPCDLEAITKELRSFLIFPWRRPFGSKSARVINKRAPKLEEYLRNLFKFISTHESICRCYDVELAITTYIKSFIDPLHEFVSKDNQLRAAEKLLRLSSMDYNTNLETMSPDDASIHCAICLELYSTDNSSNFSDRSSLPDNDFESPGKSLSGESPEVEGVDIPESELIKEQALADCQEARQEARPKAERMEVFRVCGEQTGDCAVETLVLLPCGHLFHESCVLGWFENHCTCPLCRQHVY